MRTRFLQRESPRIGTEERRGCTEWIGRVSSGEKESRVESHESRARERREHLWFIRLKRILIEELKFSGEKQDNALAPYESPASGKTEQPNEQLVPQITIDGTP